MIVDVLLFLIGVQVCQMLLAACYRIIDLWYRIGDFLMSILLRILIIAAIATTIFWLSGSHQMAFAGGLVFYLGFHISIYWIGRIAIFFMTRR